METNLSYSKEGAVVQPTDSGTASKGERYKENNF